MLIAVCVFYDNGKGTKINRKLELYYAILYQEKADYVVENGGGFMVFFDDLGKTLSKNNLLFKKLRK